MGKISLPFQVHDKDRIQIIAEIGINLIKMDVVT
jgi:hypothetical protein